MTDIIYYPQRLEYDCAVATTKSILKRKNPNVSYTWSELSSLLELNENGTDLLKEMEVFLENDIELCVLKTKDDMIAACLDKRPIVISYIIDEEGVFEYHSAIVVDYEPNREIFIVNDPYYGKGMKWPAGSLYKLINYMFMVE